MKHKGVKYLEIVLLLLMFPLLWFYNQKINYRSFFQLDRSLLLAGSGENRSSLSSVVYILNTLKGDGISATLLPKTIATSEFGVLGRVIETKAGRVEIYEYGNMEAAAKVLRMYSTGDVTQYKNLLIRGKLGVRL